MSFEASLFFRLTTSLIIIISMAMMIVSIHRKLLEVPQVLLIFLWFTPSLLFQIDRIYNLIFDDVYLIPDGDPVHYISAFLRLQGILTVSAYAMAFILERRHIRKSRNDDNR